MRINVQISETTPIAIVETSGVRKRGWMRPKAFGIEPNRAIDRVVRAVGRIVVWVDAEAEVSTAMIRILSRGEPKTCPPRALRTSSALWVLKPGPAKATAAVPTIT